VRGDKYPGSFSFADARALAGSAQGYWRQEFVRPARLADGKHRSD